MLRLVNAVGQRPRLPPIVAYILRNAAVGALLGAAFGAFLLLTNAFGMQGLITGSRDPVTPVIMLEVGFATLIGSLYVGASIMTLPDSSEGEGR